MTDATATATRIATEDDTCFLIDGLYGRYVPQRLAETVGDRLEGVDQTAIDTLLAGPDAEGYWDAYQDALNGTFKAWGDEWWIDTSEAGDIFAIRVGVELPDLYPY